MKVLLVEDNKDIAMLIFDYFENLGMELDYASNGTHGFSLAMKGSYDCILLDLMLPGLDGNTICKQLRELGKNIPIIMLTARDADSDMLEGFNSGADDYVVKPFDLSLLHARMKAVTRRVQGVGFEKSLVCGPIEIDVQRRLAFRDNQRLVLNPTCYSLLLFLVQTYPMPASKQDIERCIWSDDLPDADVLRKHIYQLRGAVDKPFDRQIIKTIPKIGYTIEF
ncbi:MAG: response regulator transcription factor [Pseudomonadota bacterium]